MRKIKWSEEANSDLEQIYDFISQDSIYYSIKTIKDIIKKTSILLEYPYLGRKIKEINDEKIREFIYKSYRIIYKIDSNVILILRIWHTERNLKTINIPKL